MTTGDIYIGEVSENDMNGSSNWKINKPYSIIPIEGGFNIVPIDIQILQSADIDSINLLKDGIQYYTDLKNCEMYYDAYIQATQTIIGTEPQKIIM